MKNLKYLPLLLVAIYFIFIVNNHSITNNIKWLFLLIIGILSAISMFYGYSKIEIHKNRLIILAISILASIAIFLRYLFM
jgi:hypothetical protein